MALYRHVTNKADLLDGIVELLLTEFLLHPPALGPIALLDSLTRSEHQRSAIRASFHFSSNGP